MERHQIFYNSQSIKLKARDRSEEANKLEQHAKSFDIYPGVHMEKKICRVLIGIIMNKRGWLLSKFEKIPIKQD